MRALLVLVLFLAGLAFGADRLVERWAEGYVADQVGERAGLAGSPDVDVRGIPFLTQAAAGRYDEVRISLTAEQLGQPRGTRADVLLHGAQVPLSSVFSGSVQEIPVDRIDGTARLSYELLSGQLGPGIRLARDGEDRLRIVQRVETLGGEFTLTAAGTVTLDGADLVVEVAEASAADVEVPDSVLDRAVALLDLRYTVPELPFGLRLTGVQPGDDGVDIRLEAADTVLRAVEQPSAGPGSSGG